jgi:hypothetical protein
VEQLAACVASERLRVSMPRHVHDLCGGRPGHICRRHESPAQTVGANGVDLAGCRAGVTKEPLHDFGHEPPLDPGVAQFAVRRKRDEQRALLLLADGKPRLESRDRARPVLQPRHRDELPRPTLIGLALADRDDQKTGPGEVEVLDIGVTREFGLYSTLSRSVSVGYTVS